MGNTKWKGYLKFKAVNPEIDSVIRSELIPVKKFAVKGGTKREVDLSSTDDITLLLEIQEAKMFKNISVFLPRTKGFEWHQLWEIAEHDLPVMVSFAAQGKIGNTTTHRFFVTSSNAKITEQPVKVRDFDNCDVLRVRFSLPDIEIIHGSQEGGEVTM